MKDHSKKDNKKVWMTMSTGALASVSSDLRKKLKRERVCSGCGKKVTALQTDHNGMPIAWARPKHPLAHRTYTVCSDCKAKESEAELHPLVASLRNDEKFKRQNDADYEAAEKFVADGMGRHQGGPNGHRCDQCGEYDGAIVHTMPWERRRVGLWIVVLVEQAFELKDGETEVRPCCQRCARKLKSQCFADLREAEELAKARKNSASSQMVTLPEPQTMLKVVYPPKPHSEAREDTLKALRKAAGQPEPETTFKLKSPQTDTVMSVALEKAAG